MIRPLGQESEFNRGGHIVPGTSEKQGKRRNMLNLKKSFQVYARMLRDGIAGLEILPLTTAGREIGKHSALLPGEIERIAR
jgi:hypothetical protein